jgi:hypothetical protein
MQSSKKQDVGFKQKRHKRPFNLLSSNGPGESRQTKKVAQINVPVFARALTVNG